MKIERENRREIDSKGFIKQKPKKRTKEEKTLEDCQKEMREIFKGNQDEERKSNEEKANKTSSPQSKKPYQKLEEELQKAQDAHTKMVRANRLVRQGDLLGLTHLFDEPMAKNLMEPDPMGRVGFADYELHEAKNKIEVLKHKLENIQDQYELEPTEYHIKGTMVRENYEAGRLQIFFNGPPPKETQKTLLSEGFKWAKRQGAWQRPLNNTARTAAENVLNPTQEIS